MAKIKEFTYSSGKWHQYLYWCEGCGCEHAFGLESEKGHHTFNGSLYNPTVNPSLLENSVPEKVCHSYIYEGKIKYLSDCFHHLAGQTIELPDIDKIFEERKR